MPTTFEFEFDPIFRPMVLLMAGATPGNSRVVVGDDEVEVRFGRLGMRTPLSNVEGVCITRDYKWWKAIGARGSLADSGATFGTNANAGVCITFHDAVKALPMPGGNPGLTVTVADVEGLAEAVREAAGLDG